MHELTMNDFFCGCGGMAVGFRNAGYRVVGAWDFDKYAVQSYRENLGDHVKEADIREMCWKDVPAATVWAFGFPCQDLSNAGKRAGFAFICNECQTEWEHDGGEGATQCPKCGSQSFKAKTRSAMFFEMMRLLEETKENAPEQMPAILVAENVKGLKKFIPTLMEELHRRGYIGHIELYNSKYFDVAQNRERYYIIATRQDLPDTVKMPSKQEGHQVPRLADFLDENVDEKFYISDEKAQGIIQKALEKLLKEGKLHTAPTEPTALRNARNEYGKEIRKQYEAGETDAKWSDVKSPEPRTDGISNTLTTVLKDNLIIEPAEEVEKAICDETGLLNPNEIGRTLRVAGGGSLSKKHNYQHILEASRQPSPCTFWRECPNRHRRLKAGARIRRNHRRRRMSYGEGLQRFRKSANDRCPRNKRRDSR